MSRKRYDEAFKRKVIQEYEAGGISCYGLGKKYGVDAKIIGRVEASEDGNAQVHLTSEHGTFVYNK